MLGDRCQVFRSLLGDDGAELGEGVGAFYADADAGRCHLAGGAACALSRAVGDVVCGAKLDDDVFVRRLYLR